MRVPTPTVLAQRRARLAHAVSALIDHHAVAGTEVMHLRSRGLDHARDLVPQDLRLGRERDRPPALVAVVVGMSGEDVQIGAAEPDRRNPQQDLPRPRMRPGHLAHLDPAYAHQYRGAHPRPHGSRLTRHRLADHCAPRTDISSTSTDAMVLGGTAGSRVTKLPPVSAASMVSGLPPASR